MRLQEFISIIACMLIVGLAFTHVIFDQNDLDEVKSDYPAKTMVYRPTRGTQSMNEGIWLSAQEIQQLPMSGPAWDALKSQADKDAGSPDLSDQDQMNNVYVMAKALVYTRTGIETYRTEVRAQLEDAIDTELGGRTLALGRELAAYVISADLIDLKNYDPIFDSDQFRPWLKRTLTENLDGRTLQSTHEDRPNNWGTHAGASRVAVAVYLGNRTELDRAASIFEGWLGNRSSYSDFKYGELSWQADPNNPVGINPKGSTKDGYSIDGVIPDDMRRGDTFQFPPVMTGYPWGGLEGATVQAQILHHQGYDAWNWEEKALYRAAKFLYDISQQYDPDWWAHGDDEWNVWLINNAYETNFSSELPARIGKNMGWTDWTHANGSGNGTLEDIYPPFAMEEVPGRDAINVPWDTNIVIHVKDTIKGVNLSSIVMKINQQTVMPEISGTPADYTLTYDPPSDFAPNSTVEVTIDSQDQNIPPNVMVRYVNTFQIAADSEPPTVPSGLTGEFISGTEISLSWTNSSDDNGISEYRIYRDGEQITSTNLTSYHDSSLIPGTDYTYCVSALDKAGLESNKSEAITVAYLPLDNTPPSIISTTPVNGSNDVSIYVNITITFSEPVDLQSLDSQLETSDDITILETFLSFENRTLTLVLLKPLVYNRFYTITLGSGICDAAGNNLTDPFSLTFKTEQEEPISNNEGSSSFMIDHWWLIVLMIIVLIFIVLFVSRRKRHKEDY